MTYAEILRGYIDRSVLIVSTHPGMILQLRDDDAKPRRMCPTITDVGDDYIRLDYKSGRVRLIPLNHTQFDIRGGKEKQGIEIEF